MYSMNTKQLLLNQHFYYRKRLACIYYESRIAAVNKANLINTNSKININMLDVKAELN